MIVVLDSNEYINYLNKISLKLDLIFKNEKFTIFLNELIVKEVLRAITKELKKEFYRIIFNYNLSVNNEKLPLGLFKKYNDIGLKKGDIEIAAFCEYIKADYLITENRHFLKNIALNKFQILNLNNFLNKLAY